MKEWELFLERGKKDLYISEKLFQKNKDYELASYMAQQALEKHIKSYLLKLDFIKKPIQVGHLQLSGIISLIKSQATIVKRNTKNTSPLFELINRYTKMLDKLIEFFRVINRDDAITNHWWKYSLRIIENIEDKSYDKLVKPIFVDIQRLENSFVNIQKIFSSDKNLKAIEKYSPELYKEIKTFTTEINSTLKSMSKKNENVLSESLQKSEFGIGILHKILDLKKLGIIIGGMSISDFEKSIVFSKVLVEHIQLIIQIYPHEVIGRYPRSIGYEGVSSTELYKNRKDEVWRLIQNVKKSCNILENNHIRKNVGSSIQFKKKNYFRNSSLISSILSSIKRLFSDSNSYSPKT